MWTYVEEILTLIIAVGRASFFNTFQVSCHSSERHPFSFVAWMREKTKRTKTKQEQKRNKNKNETRTKMK